MKAVKCPVCEGAGKLPNGEPCHGCSSLGWIQISEVDECVVVPRQEEQATEKEIEPAETGPDTEGRELNESKED